MMRTNEGRGSKGNLGPIDEWLRCISVSVGRLHDQGASEVTSPSCKIRSHLIKNTNCSASPPAHFHALFDLPFVQRIGNPLSRTRVRQNFAMFHGAARIQPRHASLPQNINTRACSRLQTNVNASNAFLILEACFSPPKEPKEWQTWTTTADNLVGPKHASNAPVLAQTDGQIADSKITVLWPIRLAKRIEDGPLSWGSGKARFTAVWRSLLLPTQFLTYTIAILFPVTMHSILAAFIVYVNQHINSDFNLPSSIVSFITPSLYN
jgi:hypothetical protein